MQGSGCGQVTAQGFIMYDYMLRFSSANSQNAYASAYSDAADGLTLEWLELWPAEPWLHVSISAPPSKCACAAARTLASQAMGEECPELSLPLHPGAALS